MVVADAVPPFPLSETVAATAALSGSVAVERTCWVPAVALTPGAEAAWVRAHVHRRKGDRPAAESAYGEAGKPWPVDSLENEWNEIAGVALLRS